MWKHELPEVAVPEALGELASPLSPSSTLTMLNLLKQGNLEFCSSRAGDAQIYCSNKATTTLIGTGFGPSICILLIFDYNYGGQVCGTSVITTTSSVASEASLYSSIFFTPTTLAQGKILNLPNTSSSYDTGNARFLPKALATSLELNPSHLQDLMRIYGVAKGSPMEFAMNNTLVQCNLPPLAHELKACQASQEDMVTFVTNTLGHNIVALNPTKLSHQKAKVLSSKLINEGGLKVISCHSMMFPSVIYSCHMIPRSEVVDVRLQLANGGIARGLAICHLDTSYWEPAHIAFKIVHKKPGKGTICHWLPENTFIFVQKIPTTKAAP